MKRIASGLLTACLLAALAAPVAAGGYGHGYRHHFGHRHVHNHYRHHGNQLGYFAGGLVLGALLTPPRYVAPPPHVVYVPQPVPQPVVVTQVPAQAAVGRRLLRDINGQCFERQIDGAGNEMRVQLPPSECAW